MRGKVVLTWHSVRENETIPTFETIHYYYDEQQRTRAILDHIEHMRSYCEVNDFDPDDLVKEGTGPNEIARAIVTDEIVVIMEEVFGE